VNFSLNEDQALFRATVERFAGTGDVESRKAVRAQPGGVDRARWSALAELGLLSLEDPVDCAVIAETLGQASAVEPWLECGYWPARLAQGSALGDEIADGAVLAAVAFAEPGRRYALDPKVVKATRHDQHWTVSGNKTFVLGGAAADLFLVTADTDSGSALFAVARDAADIRTYAVVDGGHAAEIALRDAPATPIENAHWDDAIAEARLMAAAETVGLASRLFDETLDYVRQREQFGQAIGRFQAVQHRLVDCYAKLEQMRSTLWRATLLDRDGDWQREMAGAKAFISERALHIGQEAIQLHGGMGVTDELAIGHAHKRVLLLSRLFGDPASEIARFACAA
jgi:alkylation response protein AidB-like acyl-CoA dehydrogenase